MPPLIFERMEFLNREKNPYFEHAEAEYFIAERDGEPVGRITAQIDERWDEYQGGSDAMFGFFETVDDPEVAAALLDAADRVGARHGAARRILGPMDFTTNDEIGILIEGYELRADDPRALAPALLPELIEAHGFGKAMDLLMWELQFGDLKEGERFDPSIHAAAEKALSDEGMTIRNIDKRNLARRDAPLHRRLQRGLGRQLGLRPDRPTPRSSSTPRTSSRCSTRTGPTSPKRTARRSAPRSPCPTSTRCWRS